MCRQEIEKLVRMLPPKDGRQNMLFSATYPSNISELAKIALRPEYQLVDTVGEEDTHAAETVRSIFIRLLILYPGQEIRLNRICLDLTANLLHLRCEGDV